MLKSTHYSIAKQPKQIYMHINNNSDECQLSDLEVGLPRRSRKIRRTGLSKMRQILSLQTLHRMDARSIFLGSLALGICILFVIVVYEQLVGYGSSMSSQTQASIRTHHPYRDLKNLVMVAGHAVYTSTGCDKLNGEASWFLESYQKNPGQAATFVQHIRAGVLSAASDENALLLFSGGETRKDAGPRSEAQSYWTVAESRNWFGAKQTVRWRSLTEEHARDSFENLLFSICRFKELTGQYPWNITVVSYDFKELRFASLHRLALRFPASRFFFKGTPATPSSAAAASKGEQSVQMQFQQDPYGCAGSLHMKRLARDPFARSIPYPAGCSELKELFSYCGALPFPGTLPWDD